MKAYKRWKRVYLALMILIGILIPLEFFDWLISDGEFPFTTIVIGAFVFSYRAHHLNQLKDKASSEKMNVQ